MSKAFFNRPPFHTNVPLQACGVEGKSVMWKGKPRTIKKLFMNGRHARALLDMGGGKTETVSMVDLEKP